MNKLQTILKVYLSFQCFKRIATRTDQQTDEIDFRMLFLWNPNLVMQANIWRAKIRKVK
jgi:hypothetical protein